MMNETQHHHDGQASQPTAGPAGEPNPATPTSADTATGADQAPAAIQDAPPEGDLRQHAEMLARVVADCSASGLLVVRGRDAHPLGSGEERFLAPQPDDSDIVNGVKHIRTCSRKIPNQIVNATEDIAEQIPFHHLYAPLAIMDDALPAGQPGREPDIVGVLGLVAYVEGVTDLDERLPLEPDYVLACGEDVQAFYLLGQAVLVAQAKPVAIALQERTACHPATAELAFGWWIAGTIRYQPKGDEFVWVVKPWDGKSRTRLADLEKALGLPTLPPAPDGWPEPLGLAAYRGLLRKFVAMVLPHSEADPAALAVHFLVTFGNAAGPGPHAKVEADRHAGNLFAAFVGPTAAGRKGTASGHLRRVFQLADPDWAKHHVRSGMSTGEGVIQALSSFEEGHENEAPTDDQDDDKRLLLREGELSRMFRAMMRPRSILSPVLRDAWDGHDLETLTKHKPLRVSKPHVSIAGDITVDELRDVLGRVELVNGFANRFLFVCTRRSKHLPEGSGLTESEIDALVVQLREVLQAARKIGCVERDPAARELWAKIYSELAAGETGLLGAATSRAAAQVVRLSVIYALMDGSQVVRTEHLEAAREVWRYCSDSARYVLSHAPDVLEDELLEYIASAGDDGRSGTQLRDLSGRHGSTPDRNAALARLERAGLIAKIKVKGKGRPKTIWVATK
jgi:hypothetical protein